MSKGPGRIERIILAEISSAYRPSRLDGRPGSVLISSRDILDELFQPMVFDPDWNHEQPVRDWKPSPAQRKAVTRAMHSVVRKHQQYALTGGRGRKQLFLYDTADPLSVAWAKARVARKGFVSRQEARQMAMVTAPDTESASPDIS